MQQRSAFSVPKGTESSPLPIHFGAHLRLLRDRYGLSQSEVVACLPAWQQAAYSKVEKGIRAPLFDQLGPIYQALRDAGVQLTVQDREHFFLLARDLLESRQRRHARQSDAAWSGLYARLATIDGLPVGKEATRPSPIRSQNRAGHLPRREIGHLIGREAWLQSVTGILTGPSPAKVVILHGPPGCGKSSELHRVVHQAYKLIPHTCIVLSEPPPIQLGRLDPIDVLERLLADTLEGVGPSAIPMPTRSVQARISTMLGMLTTTEQPVVLALDNAEHLLDEHGGLSPLWQQFLSQFVQASHQAVLLLASQQWPAGMLLSQLVVTVEVPPLSRQEGVQLLRTLGLKDSRLDLLDRAVGVVGGLPICLEWLVKLVREPFLRDEWAEFADEEDEETILERLLDDPALFGGSVAGRVQPLLDHLLTRLSPESLTALRDLAVAPVPLGAPALKELYQTPSVLKELREASLLTAYPQRVQLLPMVAAQVRRMMSDEQIHAAEKRLIGAVRSWLQTGMLQQQESGNVVAELATLYLKHGHILEAAHLLVRYGWAAFNLGYGPRLARLVQESLLTDMQDKQHKTSIPYKCGMIVLKHYLGPFLNKADDCSMETEYREVLSHILAEEVQVQPSFEVHILHHLMLFAINVRHFEEAQQLFESACERLSPFLSENRDLHASLLERQAYLEGRWSDWLKEQDEQEASCVHLNHALALYQECADLLSEVKHLPVIEISICQKRRARVLNGLGYRLNSLGRYQEAKTTIAQSILLKEQGFTEIGALASSYGEMAQAQAGLGCFQTAFCYNDMALKEVRRLAQTGHQSSQEELWVYLVERGKLHWLIGQVEQAEQLLNETKHHISDRRSAFRAMAQHILDDIQQWKHASHSHIYQLDWRWIDELRQWVSFPLYEWLDPAGPLTVEEQQRITLLMTMETEEAREQKHQVIRHSQQEEVARALREQRNPSFSYPAIPLDRVQLQREKLRSLDDRILREEPNRWVREWYHGTIEEHLTLLSLVEATAEGNDGCFWLFMQHLFPAPSEAEQQETLAYVRRVLAQASLHGDMQEVAQRTVSLFAEQFGITLDLALQSGEVTVGEALTPAGETGRLVSAQVAKQFFERVFEQKKYPGWQVVISAHASNPYADSPSRQLVLPVTDQSVKQILSIYEHAVLDHVESTIAGEQSRLGLLGIGLPGYTLSREGSALYQQRKAAEEAEKAFDDSAIWAGTLGILLACRVVDSSRAFYYVYSCLRQVFYLYRRLRRPDQDAMLAWEKADEIARKYCLQLYRGKTSLESKGCWTKPIVYLRGLHIVEQAVADDPTTLDALSLGKMAIEHIPLLQDLQIIPSKDNLLKKEEEKHSAEALLLSLSNRGKM